MEEYIVYLTTFSMIKIIVPTKVQFSTLFLQSSRIAYETLENQQF